LAGGLSASDHRWLRLSFLNFETQTTPGQQADWRFFVTYLDRAEWN